MSIKVNCVDEKKAKAELKNCPKVVQEYVKALVASNERWKYVNGEALKKIREQAKIMSIPIEKEVASFVEWQLLKFKEKKLDLIKEKENGQSMWFYNTGTLPLLRISTTELYLQFKKERK